jgi:hypothetical protein
MKAVVLGPAVLAAILVAGCRSASIVPPPQRDIEQQLNKMRASGKPFYFAGREFAGLRLSAAQFEDWHDGGFFAYGTCSIPAPPDGGCSPPAQIQISRFDPRLWARAVGCYRQPSLLGVPTVRHDALVLVSKGAVVKIYARTHAEDRRIALSLRSLDRPMTILQRLSQPSRAARRLLTSVCH